MYSTCVTKKKFFVMFFCVTSFLYISNKFQPY